MGSFGRIGVYAEFQTSLSVCPVSLRLHEYMIGRIGIEEMPALLLLQMSFRPTCCPQGYRRSKHEIN